ncbi:hypothetical protein [Sulfitobacter sp. PM12]|uniref:hypothetical protein n=1 Tax=Sulfitobacter sp. PM12 TaxID=3138497 RepID=UPI00388D4C9C
MNIKDQLEMQARYTAQARGETLPKTEAPDELTREGIAKMKRADVVEHLEAHGLSEDDCEGVKVADLRDMLTNAVFTSL